MKYHTVFFDLDGTLTASAPGILNCVRYALERMGIDPGEHVTAKNFVGPPLVQSFSQHYGMDDQQAKQALTFYRERFSTVGLFENSVYAGIPETLATLQDAGKQLVIATGKPEVYALRILDHFDLSKYFVHVAGSLLDGSRDDKIAVLRYAMQLCDSGCDRKSNNDCVMVGDRATDVAAARTCGMQAVGVRWGDGVPGELDGADAVADTPEALTRILLA